MAKLAIVTGATSGIGLSFAKIFASEKYDLIIVGRNKDRLINIEKDLSEEYKINVKFYAVDLSDRNELENMWSDIEANNEKIDILINNAGAGFNGEFANIDFEKHEQIMEVNMRSVTRLSYLAVNNMKKFNSGKILNVASTGSFQAGAMIGVYYASKAYVLSLSTAIREEVSDKGIVVSTICPGATKTQFSKRAGKEDLNVAMSADYVAMIGYKGLMKNKAIIVPGFMNKCAITISKLMPYILSAKVVKSIQSKAMEKNK